MMDRRAFLGALAAAGLIPKTWAEDAPAVAPPVVADSDDFDDFGWGDDFDWEDDDLGLPPLPEPEPPPPPPPPVRSEGPDVLIVNGTEIRCKTFSWHREVHDWMDERGWMCHTVSSALDLEITSTDEATEKVACEAGRELTVGYREDGWLYPCGMAYVTGWNAVQHWNGPTEHHLSLRVFRGPRS